MFLGPKPYKRTQYSSKFLVWRKPVMLWTTVMYRAGELLVYRRVRTHRVLRAKGLSLPLHFLTGICTGLESSMLQPAPFVKAGDDCYKGSGQFRADYGFHEDPSLMTRRYLALYSREAEHYSLCRPSIFPFTMYSMNTPIFSFFPSTVRCLMYTTLHKYWKQSCQINNWLLFVAMYTDWNLQRTIFCYLPHYSFKLST